MTSVYSLCVLWNNFILGKRPQLNAQHVGRFDLYYVNAQYVRRFDLYYVLQC